MNADPKPPEPVEGPRHPHAIWIKRDPIRCVEIAFNCGHSVRLNLPRQLDPDPGDVLHCYECGEDVLVKEVRPC